MKLTEKHIQKALFENFGSHKYRFANAFFFNNESDFLSFMPSGFCYECEIKISRSDFKADFKKEKHEIHRSNADSGQTFLRKTYAKINSNPSWEMCSLYPDLVDAREYVEYNRFTGEYESRVHLYMTISSGVEFVSRENTMLPNKFFYAVPTGLITKNEVPSYAGLLYVDENLKVTKVKDGIFLHKDKLDVNRLWNKAYYSYERELQDKFKQLVL